MVTFIVGSANRTKSRANIVTCCPEADEPKVIEFDTNALQPGKPK